ncbi:MAG TPA: GIY-YIG nuclease family protein [Pyrinomonadaceae bacterium]
MKNKRHKALTQQYKDTSRPLGVFLIRNSKTDRVFLGCGIDLRGTINRHKFQLSSGTHPNRELQMDWNNLGPNNFEFEIVEELEPRSDPFDPKTELEFMEKMWLERLKPYGVRGYNKAKIARPWS